MLPIRQPEGIIAGFIGRAPEGTDNAKYINSPGTNLFRKGELLFGLHEVGAQLALGARPVLVEGPFDAIAVNTAAADEFAAVAPCGTAITAAQLAALGQLADLDRRGVLLALDGDLAGRAAALRAWDVLAKVDGPLHVTFLPESSDPAEVLRYQGCMAVREALQSKLFLADVVIDASIERAGGALEEPEERMAAVRAAATVLAASPAPQLADRVARIADRLDVGKAIVTQALIQAISPDRPEPNRPGPVQLARDGFPLPPLSTGPQPVQSAGDNDPASHVRTSLNRRSP